MNEEFLLFGSEKTDLLEKQTKTRRPQKIAVSTIAKLTKKTGERIRIIFTLQKPTAYGLFSKT